MMAPLVKEWKTLTGSCCRAAKAVGRYLESLRIYGIQLADPEFSRHRFTDMINRQIPSLPFDITPEGAQCPAYKTCPCSDDIGYDLTSELRRAKISLQLHQRSFFCLDCVKSEDKFKQTEACRVNHSKDLILK